MCVSVCVYIYIYIWHHHHVAPSAWISLTLSRHPPYHPLLLAVPQGYIPYLHRAAVCRFELVTLPLLGHVKGSTSVHHLWAWYITNPHIYIIYILLFTLLTAEWSYIVAMENRIQSYCILCWLLSSFKVMSLCLIHGINTTWIVHLYKLNQSSWPLLIIDIHLVFMPAFCTWKTLADIFTFL